MFVVTGATGNVGSAVVAAFAEQGAPVRAVSRKGAPSALTCVESVAGDLNDPTSLAPALTGATAVFLLSGYDHFPELLGLAKDAGVARVALLSSASVPTGKRDNAVVEYHTRAEEDVRASGLAWTILRPSMFMTNALQWTDQLAAGDVVRAPFPHVAAAVVDPADIGAVAATAMRDGAHDGEALRLTGPAALTPAERVAVLGEVLGRDLRFDGMTDDEAVAELDDTMPEQYAQAFRRFYVDGELDESPVLPTVAQVLGREPHDFAHWVTEHAAAFTTPA